VRSLAARARAIFYTGTARSSARVELAARRGVVRGRLQLTDAGTAHASTRTARSRRGAPVSGASLGRQPGEFVRVETWRGEGASGTVRVGASARFSTSEAGAGAGFEARFGSVLGASFGLVFMGMLLLAF